MAGGEERYYIPSFDGNNFDSWKFGLGVLLEEKNCLECLDGMDSSYNVIDSDDAATKAVKTKQIQDFLKKDRNCKSIITQSVADSYLKYIKDKHTANEMWNSLQNTFERKGIRNQLLLRKQLLQLKLEERGTLNSHFLIFDSIVQSLKASGATLEENDIICHLLLTLPKSYEMVITTIETIGGSNLTLDFVKGKLLDEEIKQKSKTNMKKRIHWHGKRNANNTVSGNCEDTIVFEAESCNGENRDANNTISGNSKNGIGFKADLGNGNCVTTLNWFLDSGATDHMINSECYFAETWELQHEIKISVAKYGEAITARKAGNVRGNLVVNGEMVKCTIKNVLFVPNLEHNLISITRLETSGVAKRQRGIYELEIYLDMKTANANLSLYEKEDLWQKRYGHIGNESLQKIINLNMVNGIEILNIKNTKKCETCIYDESFEDEREVEVQTDKESGKEKSARNTWENLLGLMIMICHV
ncbi:hypothetical protein ILUMI_18637 [Ignelater luminosus]|uniref:Copia protein n=1 Tax=Ignelater luminosus TaxID=2038154 RepID=A0A8K0G6C8_IGNLU|nr:hypothetical protein ILUMI_18637 [Ignelater luminosus]